MQAYGVHNKSDMKEIKSNGKENSHKRASKSKRRSNAVIFKSDWGTPCIPFNYTKFLSQIKITNAGKPSLGEYYLLQNYPSNAIIHMSPRARKKKNQLQKGIFHWLEEIKIQLQRKLQQVQDTNSKGTIISPRPTTITTSPLWASCLGGCGLN